jgi:hypothetical protein
MRYFQLDGANKVLSVWEFTFRSRAVLSKCKYESDCEQSQRTESKGEDAYEETYGLSRSVNRRNPTFKNS